MFNILFILILSYFIVGLIDHILNIITFFTNKEEEEKEKQIKKKLVE